MCSGCGTRLWRKPDLFGKDAWHWAVDDVSPILEKMEPGQIVGVRNFDNHATLLLNSAGHISVFQIHISRVGRRADLVGIPKIDYAIIGEVVQAMWRIYGGIRHLE